MNNQETINILNGLKLKGMSDAFASMVAMPTQERPGIEMGVARMAEAEQMHRIDKRTAMFY